MRAVWLKDFGGPELLTIGEAADPVAGPGQVVVDVELANITFVETQLRATGSVPYKIELPAILGNGAGGVVSAVGAGVDGGLVGRRVVTSTGGSGGYAERVAVPADGLFDVPDALAMDAAVALLADGRTATLLIRAVGLRSGDRVLVEAAAGGVGTLLVQLAKPSGATVIGAAGGDRKLEVARGLGADFVVDYRLAGWPELVREATGGVDVVLDGVGGVTARRAFELLDRGGRMLSFGLASGTWADITDDEAAAHEVTLVRDAFGNPEAMRDATRDALNEAAAGRLRPVIGQRFPLERAADAHAAIEARATVGKTLLEVR